MGILGIRNRTENWKTSRNFAPFFDNKEKLARLVMHLNSCDESNPEDLKIELFWKGIRDRRDRCCTDDEKLAFDSRLAEKYKQEFSWLRKKTKSFKGFRSAQPHHYSGARRWKGKLLENLKNTEIDIVIESPSHLYIGEAKGESRLHSNGAYVLVHQLIRQYVTARLLISAEDRCLKVKQFVVLDEKPMRYQNQMEFVRDERWLSERNILTWDCLAVVCRDT